MCCAGDGTLAQTVGSPSQGGTAGPGAGTQGHRDTEGPACLSQPETAETLQHAGNPFK